MESLQVAIVTLFFGDKSARCGFNSESANPQRCQNFRHPLSDSTVTPEAPACRDSGSGQFRELDGNCTLQIHVFLQSAMTNGQTGLKTMPTPYFWGAITNIDSACCPERTPDYSLAAHDDHACRMPWNDEFKRKQNEFTHINPSVVGNRLHLIEQFHNIMDKDLEPNPNDACFGVILLIKLAADQSKMSSQLQNKTLTILRLQELASSLTAPFAGGPVPVRRSRKRIYRCTSCH